MKVKADLCRSLLETRRAKGIFLSKKICLGLEKSNKLLAPNLTPLNNQLVAEVKVARPGFEPKHSESESDVLPLYYRAI